MARSDGIPGKHVGAPGHEIDEAELRGGFVSPESVAGYRDIAKRLRAVSGHDVARAFIAVASVCYTFARVLHRTHDASSALGAALVAPFFAYGIFGAWTGLASSVAEREWAIWLRDRRSALPLLEVLAALLVYVGAVAALWVAIRVATTK